MRVLSQGQIDLFDLAFARLLEVPLEKFRKTFYTDGTQLVALACRAAGIDRSVFPTVYNLSRQARPNNGRFLAPDTAEADRIFSGLTRQVALEEFKKSF